MYVHVSVSRSVTLCLVLVCVAFSKQETQCGNYVYVTQPPSEIQCNPYNTRRTKLECNVAGPNYILNSSEPEFTIKWYRKRTDLGQVEELIHGRNYPDLHIDVYTNEVIPPSVPSVLGIRSILEFNSLMNVSEGMYWCQIVLGDTDDDGIDMGLEQSNMFHLQSPESYVHVPDCIKHSTYLDVPVLECLNMMMMMTDNTSPEEPTTVSTQDDMLVVPTCSSPVTPGLQGENEGVVLLPRKWIIIIGCVGGSLLLVVVILIIFLVLVFAGRLRGRRKGQKSVLPDLERTMILKKEVKKPPPVPEKPASRSSSTMNILNSPNQSNGSVLSIPPPTTPPLIRGGVRHSLPTRLPLTVQQKNDEEYTPVLSQHDRKASTLIDKLKVACEEPRDGDKLTVDSSHNTSGYRGLNPQMMDDIQPYDSTRGAHSHYDSDIESDDMQPEYSEPNASTWNHSVALSVDGEYVYPNVDSASHGKPRANHGGYKQLTANQEEYMPVYAIPDNH